MQESKVQVRRAVTEDRQALKALMVEYIVDFYKSPKPSDEKLDQLMDMLAQGAEGEQWVAELEGSSELVGFTTIYYTYSTLRASKVAIMNDLYVKSNVRGAGVGEALFNACKASARAQGLPSLGWETAADNERAQRFYARMGGSKGSWISYSIEP